MNRYNGYRTETLDTVVNKLARGNRDIERLIHARVGAPRIPPEFEGTEIIYSDLKTQGGKHVHRRKSMSKCKSKKTRRTRNTRKRLRNYH
jgi:hypothetical protein